MKPLTVLTAIAVLLISCMSPQVREVATPQKFILEIVAVDPVAVEVKQPVDNIARGMEVSNPEGQLSQLSFVLDGKGYSKIFSGLSVADVMRFWGDLYVFEHMGIKDIVLFINSPGGGAFAGMALADEIDRWKRRGFNITAYASGIIASAAVPVFAVCSKRIASPGTIFMTHQASLWAWPGQESAADIRSKNELMILLQDQYVGYLARNSNLSSDEWNAKIDKTTWFNVDQAIEWGLVDSVE